MKLKKITCFILGYIMCLSLCACGGGDKTLSITDSNGETVSLSVKDLEKIQETDGRTWSTYIDSAISGSGKITEISQITDAGSFYADLTMVRNGKTYEYKYTEVEIDDDIRLLTRRDTFKDFYVGDNVSFNGKLVNGDSNMWLHINCCGENDYDNPELNISLIKD